jgi:hypothetical protein
MLKWYTCKLDWFGKNYFDDWINLKYIKQEVDISDST